MEEKKIDIKKKTLEKIRIYLLSKRFADIEKMNKEKDNDK